MRAVVVVVRRFVAVCLAISVVGVASGCAEKVVVPPASARPDEVLAAFLKAAIARDTKVGHELSGECWPKVADWFNAKRELFTTYTVFPQETPAPWKMDTIVMYSAEVWGEPWPAAGYDVKVRRSSPAERWRVCDVQFHGGG